MKRILITGNAGYIGSHLTKLLTYDNDYEVHGLDINPEQCANSLQFKLDINRSIGAIATIEYDAVIHLAAKVNVGESETMPIQYYITNLNGTMNVINKVKTKNFIFASTGAAEACDSAYGISKRAAEDVVKEYCTKHDPKDYTIFRFYNVIGTNGFQPTNPDGLMYNLMESAKTKQFTIFGNDYDTPDGTCIRDYVHVNEICYALREAIEKPSNKIECLGHGTGTSVKEMFDIFTKVNNIDDIKLTYGPRRKGDSPISVLKNTSPYMHKAYHIDQLLKL